MDLTMVPEAIRYSISAICMWALCGFFLYGLTPMSKNRKQGMLQILISGPMVWLFYGIALFMKKLNIPYTVGKR